MKRGLSTVLAALTFALMTGVGTASASDLLSPTGGQGNVSDQDQIQVVPIAPQINVQNANILTFDEVEQGNANNANTGQANQQSNTASGSSGGKAPGCDCGPSLADKSSGNQSNGQGQSNSSEQEQVQIVPIAPQANVQNVNVLTFDDVEQGDANNANTGQANQQENTASGSRNSGNTSGGQSQTGRQGNYSDQDQIQFVPIAPQLNVQNANVLTFGDVEQGDANNANTGQANQQSNTASGSRNSGQTSGGSSQTGRQGNSSEQEQIQFIPIAPQANFQNVNILTFDDVSQGDANNANTGQANQQSNTASSRGGYGNRGGGNCGCNQSRNAHSSGGSGRQGNFSEQEQVQFIPIAPQLNVQNTNILTFDDVSQGDANNANTGQANQQSNTASGSRGGDGNRGGSCKCSHPKNSGNDHRSSGRGNSGPSQGNSSEQEQIQFIPIAPQANFQNVNILTFDDVSQGDANNANTGQANQQSNTASGSRGGDGNRGGSCKCSDNAHRSGGSSRQGNFSEQEQVQFIPIAPQLNVQNKNILTFDDVSQGDANNANTGQANQQSNTAKGSRGGSKGQTATQHERMGGPQLDSR